jgi:hydroxyacylglutathione hydrolase
MSTRIETLTALKDNFVYVLVHGAHAAVVDPGEAAPVLRFLERHRLRLDAILCTHHHWDHVSGVPDLVKETGAEVWCSPPDRERIPGSTKAVSGLERLWDLEAEILAVPGHTLGQIAYYFPKLEAVFPGDTLFSAGCGRLFEGTPEQMFASMKKLAALPAETKVYFGHEYTLRNLEFVSKYEAAPAAAVEAYREDCERRLKNGHTTPTTIETELKINPFLNARDVATFTKWRELRNTW